MREYQVVRVVSVADSPRVAGGRLVFPAVPAGQGAAVLLQDANLQVIGAASLA